MCLGFRRIFRIMQYCLTLGMFVLHQECCRATGVTRDRGKALRDIPRGKQKLTVYRAQQIDIKRACQKKLG